MYTLQKRWTYIAVAFLLLGLVACSPEDGRVRGQLGADVNNRPDLHISSNSPQPIEPHSKVWSAERP